MEENKKTNGTVECTKCHQHVNASDAQQTTKGVVCNNCVKAQKKRNKIYAGSAAGVIVAAIAGGIYFTSPAGLTGSGFDGVGEINDSMNIVVDSANVSFDMATATAASSPVTTQAPISNLAEFKSVLSNNIDNAQKSKNNKIVIPSVSALFRMNTNYFINDGEGIVKELAAAYLQTNKKATICVEGYTCDLGEDELNTNLSKLRAEAVKDILVSAGVPTNKIETKWYGKSRYKDFNYSDKSEYRRVIVSIK